MKRGIERCEGLFNNSARVRSTRLRLSQGEGEGGGAGGTTSRTADIIDINFNRGPRQERRIPAPLIARLTARVCMIDAFEEAEN